MLRSTASSCTPKVQLLRYKSNFYAKSYVDLESNSRSNSAANCFKSQ